MSCSPTIKHIIMRGALKSGSVRLFYFWYGARFLCLHAGCGVALSVAPSLPLVFGRPTVSVSAGLCGQVVITHSALSLWSCPDNHLLSVQCVNSL